MAVDRSFSIMHVILEPRFSGAEILVRELVQIHRREGHQASVVAFKPPQDDFLSEVKALEVAGCTLCIPKKDLNKLERLTWIRAAVRKCQPDIVFAHSMLPSLYTRLALRFDRRPAIVTVLHTDDDLGHPLLRRFEEFLWKRNAGLVGVSSRSVANYQRRMTDKVPSWVIPNGINLDQFAVSPTASRAMRQKLYAAPAGEIVLLQVGRICVQKQQHVSVEALARLSARGIRNLRLVLVGLCQDPDYGAKVTACARQGGVEDRVQFAGPQANINEWLAGADIFLMPSGWEAHCIAAMEALASGVFCVFSAIDSFEAWRSHPGVMMIEAPPSGQELAARLEPLLQSNEWKCRYERDLEQYTMQRCAAAYMRITAEFAQRFRYRASEPVGDRNGS